MNVYEAANLRNVALMGHGHTGKTQLLSSLLYAAGTGNRLGLVDDGTSVTDFDEEEIQRKFSIAAGLPKADFQPICAAPAARAAARSTNCAFMPFSIRESMSSVSWFAPRGLYQHLG